jgi:signal transduction histidine kinase
MLTALRQLARRTQEDSGIVCQVRGERDGDGSRPRKALDLYRLAQEAVANAVKHAHCRLIELELLAEEDSLALFIRDDGVGYSETAGSLRGGLGIRLMAYRAERMNGTFTIAPLAEGGTRVTCRLPMDAAPEGPT